MSLIGFRRQSPRGNSIVDSSRLLIGTDGALFVKSTDAPVPLAAEEIAAVREHFGTGVDLAIKAARALA